MGRVEDRTVHAPSALPDHGNGTAEEPLEPESELTYASLPLKPTRVVAVTVRHVGKIAPRPHAAGEPD
jgi:hypothetical protein